VATAFLLADFCSDLAMGLAADEDGTHPRNFTLFWRHFLNLGKMISLDFPGEFSVQTRRYSSHPAGFPWSRRLSSGVKKGPRLTYFYDTHTLRLVHTRVAASFIFYFLEKNAEKRC
jgi:hypothetical protein